MNEKPIKTVFLDRGTIGPSVHLRSPKFEHTFEAYDKTQPAQAVERLRGAQIAIVNKFNLTAEILKELPDLKLIAVAATGTDCIDKVYCQSHGIAVSNVRGYALRSVPEHAFALMLALRRSLIPFREDTLDGAWQRAGQFCFFNHQIQDLGGARLGIVGRGALGRRVAEIAQAFGMITMFAARKTSTEAESSTTPWETVLETSDILTLHVPLTPATRGLIGMEEFRKMKRKPLLINTARGGLVDEADLEQALEEGLISGAGIDVTLPEPPPADGPLMRMAKRPNVILTPHIAWASDTAMQTLEDQLIDNIENFVAGAPSNLVEGAG